MKKHRQITEGAFKTAGDGQDQSPSPSSPRTVLGKYLARDMVDPETGEVIAELNEEIDKNSSKRSRQEGRGLRGPLHRQHQCQLVVAGYPRDRQDRPDPRRTGEVPVQESGKSVREKESEKALIDIYKRLRPGIPRRSRRRSASSTISSSIRSVMTFPKWEG